MARLYYGIGRGFYARWQGGTNNSASPRTYVEDCIRPPFTVAGTQFIRAVGSEYSTPMAVGLEGGSMDGGTGDDWLETNPTETPPAYFQPSTVAAQSTAGGQLPLEPLLGEGVPTIDKWLPQQVAFIKRRPVEGGGPEPEPPPAETITVDKWAANPPMPRVVRVSPNVLVVYGAVPFQPAPSIPSVDQWLPTIQRPTPVPRLPTANQAFYGAIQAAWVVPRLESWAPAPPIPRQPTRIAPFAIQNRTEIHPTWAVPRLESWAPAPAIPKPAPRLPTSDVPTRSEIHPTWAVPRVETIMAATVQPRRLPFVNAALRPVNAVPYVPASQTFQPAWYVHNRRILEGA